MSKSLSSQGLAITYFAITDPAEVGASLDHRPMEGLAWLCPRLSDPRPWEDSWPQEARGRPGAEVREVIGAERGAAGTGSRGHGVRGARSVQHKYCNTNWRNELTKCLYSIQTWLTVLYEVIPGPVFRVRSGIEAAFPGGQADWRQQQDQHERASALGWVSRPIRGQYPGHVICLGQSEACVQVTWSVLTNGRIR